MAKIYHDNDADLALIQAKSCNYRIRLARPRPCAESARQRL